MTPAQIIERLRRIAAERRDKAKQNPNRTGRDQRRNK